ncbi:DUF6968 family protein [Polyangium aurulentum]|uniref:DUF6968 family protein n=1 Tax=Polyangium aurulentum TaxID=2567896 RepID=UPI0010AE5361|nr:hypothetical protein [Polyangium aurulentum]UQA56221.1 hypothetical protein E8A73_033620 [Polyangium aurulentum]
MDILATRILNYSDENGSEKALVFTVFEPAEAEHGDWACSYDFDPPISRRNVVARGVDFIQAFLHCLVIARSYMETTQGSGSLRWQGMRDCGLPESGDSSCPPLEIPATEDDPGGLEILATRKLGIPDENGLVREAVLVVYRPLQESADRWRCGFAFGPDEVARVRYGTGADAIEALLDALSLARTAFDTMVPKGWAPSEEAELLDCSDLPCKIGRSFRV